MRDQGNGAAGWFSYLARLVGRFFLWIGKTLALRVAQRLCLFAIVLLLGWVSPRLWDQVGQSRATPQQTITAPASTTDADRHDDLKRRLRADDTARADHVSVPFEDLVAEAPVHAIYGDLPSGATDLLVRAIDATDDLPRLSASEDSPVQCSLLEQEENKQSVTNEPIGPDIGNPADASADTTNQSTEPLAETRDDAAWLATVSTPVAPNAPIASERIVEESSPAVVASTAESASSKNTDAPAKTANVSLSESVQRLPATVANVPQQRKALPEGDLQDLRDFINSKAEAGRESATPRDKAPQHDLTAQADVSPENPWHQPDALLEALKDLAGTKATNEWAIKTIHGVQTLGSAFAAKSDETANIVDELSELNHRARQLAAGLPERATRRKLDRASFALGRRLDVWRAAIPLTKSQPITATADRANPDRLSECLATVDTMIGDSAEGQAWRQYLLVDILNQKASQKPTPEDELMRQIAQQALVRLTQTPLTPHQRKFVTSEPLAKLSKELRHWAAEPVSAAELLRDLEHYEQSGVPSDARRLALNCQHLGMSSVEARRLLAQHIDAHYRNANVRVAISEELLNKLIPERNLEYAPVNDRVLGRQVHGESLMASELAVRLQPDPNQVRLALEVRGEIAAQTTGSAGPARFVNDSESYYVARKPLRIDMKGISLWPTEVGVSNHTRLRDVETDLDGIPLIGTVAKSVARSQIGQSTPAAKEEVKQKIAAETRRRVDEETRQRLGEVVARLNREVFDPLNSLALDPQMIDGKTTKKRFEMRLRLAGEDQLGSHTPRPQAPEDSLASVQIHESAINNCVQRLELNGQKFTLPELAKHVAQRLNRPKLSVVNPEHEDVTITFAAKDAVIVRCRDGRVEVAVAIAELAKAPHRWKNFQVKAFYRPEIVGRSAELKREGVVQFNKGLSTGAQFSLRGIFSKAFSKNASWELMPERIVQEPKLGYAAVTQFEIVDGWLGISLGPKREASRPAARWR